MKVPEGQNRTEICLFMQWENLIWVSRTKTHKNVMLDNIPKVIEQLLALVQFFLS